MSTPAPSFEPQIATESRVFVGRQAIFDRKLEVHAYELLYRSGEANSAQISDGELATAEVLVASLTDIGLGRLVDKHLAFINVTRDFVLERRALSLPPERVVLEILEDVKVDRALVDAVADLSARGYAIALDDFVYAQEFEPLVALANIVKIDVMALGLEESRRHVEQLRAKGPPGLELLAEKVESQTEFEALFEMNFDYFQGYFFAKPKVITGTRLSVNKLAVLQLSSALHRSGVDVAEVESLVEQDVALTYKLFRYINSAFYSLPKEVTSIRRAVVCLGMQPLKRMVTLLALAGVDEKPPELLRMALLRGKMSEHLAVAMGGVDPGAAFTGGLFSALNILMDAPLEDVLSELHLSPELEAALLERSGVLGRILDCTIAYERCEWDAVTLPPCSDATIRDAFVDASEWSFRVYAGLELGARPQH